MKAISILIADDHEVVRQGLRLMLRARPNWTVCGEATTGREAVAMAQRLKPTVVVADLSMPELNGLEAARQIRRALPDTEVLILTMHDSEDLARQALAAGARGYILKSDTQNQLLTAIETLARHEPYFTPKVSALVLEAYLHPAANPPPAEGQTDRVTPREREIIQMIAEGKTSKEIASTLGISDKTVEAHRANILNKLNLRSSVDLVRYAIRNRIIQA